MQTLERLTASGSDDDQPTFATLVAGDVFRFADRWGDHLWLKTDNPAFDAVCLSDGELISVFGDPCVAPVACKITPLGP